jgi:hypothetical protein
MAFAASLHIGTRPGGRSFARWVALLQLLRGNSQVCHRHRYLDELCRLVAGLLNERDSDGWERQGIC